MKLTLAIGAEALIEKLDRMEVIGDRRVSTLRHALAAAEQDGRDADRRALMVALTDPRCFQTAN